MLNSAAELCVKISESKYHNNNIHAEYGEDGASSENNHFKNEGKKR
jgi:hypothetical protein